MDTFNSVAIIKRTPMIKLCKRLDCNKEDTNTCMVTV